MKLNLIILIELSTCQSTEQLLMIKSIIIEITHKKAINRNGAKDPYWHFSNFKKAFIKFVIP